MAKGGKGGIRWVTVGGSKVPLIPSPKKGGKPSLGGVVGRKIRAEKSGKPPAIGSSLSDRLDRRKALHKQDVKNIQAKAGSGGAAKATGQRPPAVKSKPAEEKSTIKKPPALRSNLADRLARRDALHKQDVKNIQRKARDADLPTGQKSPAAKAGLARVVARRDAQDKQNAALAKAGSSARPPGIQRPGLSGQNVPARGSGIDPRRTAGGVAAKAKARSDAAGKAKLRADDIRREKASAAKAASARNKAAASKLSPSEKKSLKGIQAKGKAKTDAASKAAQKLSILGRRRRKPGRAAALKAIRSGKSTVSESADYHRNELITTREEWVASIREHGPSHEETNQFFRDHMDAREDAKVDGYDPDAIPES